MLNKKSVDDINVKGKKVLVRCDFNVPRKDGKITNDNRIIQALPTIKYLVENNAKIILMSHLGKVKTEEDKAKNDLRCVAERLNELVDTKVTFVPVTRGEELENAVAALNDGEIVVMQNTRYEKGESKNDPELAAYWAKLGDLFVEDAFGSVHRAHASTAGIASILPNALGFLVEKEVKMLGAAVDTPERPFVAIIGGAKVSDKIAVVDNLLKKADKVLIGGGMAYTFLKAMGCNVGKSLVEEDKVELAKEYIEKAEGKLILPVDHVCADKFAEDANTVIADNDSIPADYMGLDIGPKSIELYKEALAGAKTVVWNGPMGVFEMAPFAKGTLEVCTAISELPGATTVIGGGDSAAAAIQLERDMRKPIIVGNWKMNKTMKETKEFMEAVDAAAASENAVFGIGAPYTALSAAVAGAKNLVIAAENCHWEDSGAFTGEISVPMLQEVGVTHCIIGHSERREMFNDTDETVNKKAKRLIDAGITPILCIGETEAQYDAGDSEKVIRDQLTGSLADMCPKCVGNMVIAYEPIWAIGTGKSASVEIAENCCRIVRDQIRVMYGDEAAENVRVQYGGSVKPNNIVEYMAQPDIDGALIGGASLKADSF